MNRLALLIATLSLTLVGCSQQDRQLEIEVRRSFKNFVFSVDELHREGLMTSVYFPDTSDYVKHVSDVRYKYMKQLENGEKLTFDDQGIVLARILGMVYNSYTISEIKPIEGSNDIEVRFVYNFAFDSVLKRGGYEAGTRIYIPGQPWGSYYTIIVDEDCPAPREQLKHVELIGIFRRTNHEGYWQLRSLKADENSIEYETSILII